MGVKCDALTKRRTWAITLSLKTIMRLHGISLLVPFGNVKHVTFFGENYAEKIVSVIIV